jgi:hypothetical protein
MTEGQASEARQGAPAPAETHVEAQPEAERSFSQADLKKIAANEKREGKQSAINELLEKTGAESIDDVMAAYSEYSEIRDAVESEADRATQKAEKAEAKAKQYQERYIGTLKTFALRDGLRDAGINPERIGAAMRIADTQALEVDAEGNVSGVAEVIEAVSEEAPEFFGQGSQGSQRVSAPQTNGTDAQLARPGQTPEEAHAQWLLDIFRNPP